MTEKEKSLEEVQEEQAPTTNGAGTDPSSEQDLDAEKEPYDPKKFQANTLPPGFRLQMALHPLPRLERKYLEDTAPPNRPLAEPSATPAVSPEHAQKALRKYRLLVIKRVARKYWLAFAAASALAFLAYQIARAVSARPSGALEKEHAAATAAPAPVPPARVTAAAPTVRPPLPGVATSSAPKATTSAAATADPSPSVTAPPAAKPSRETTTGGAKPSKSASPTSSPPKSKPSDDDPIIE